MKTQQEYDDEDFVNVLNNAIDEINDNQDIRKRNNKTTQPETETETETESETEYDYESDFDGETFSVYQQRIRQENLDDACFGAFFVISCISIVMYLII